MPFDGQVPGRVFLGATIVSASLTVLVFGFIFATALPVFLHEGTGFLTGTVWDYATNEYGILKFITGTMVVTAVSMCMAVPLSLFTAVFLSEWAPARIDRVVTSVIELLVGIPSVVYGIFGFFVLNNLVRDYVKPFFNATLGVIPVFHASNLGNGLGIFLAASVLAVMILPTVTSLTREALRSVPGELREGSLSLGATRWETVRMIVIPAAMSGIITSIILGLMRAMGETMAVVMVIGNVAIVPGSIFDYAYPMTSKIINDIGYHLTEDLPKSALFGIGAVLFLLEFVMVAIIRVAARHFRRGVE
jgi:phosphate transport system permease protein